MMAQELSPEKLKRARRIQFSLMPTEVWVIAEALKALPKDTILMNVGYEWEKRQWCMIIVSDKFGIVGEGEVCPEIQIRADLKTKKVELIAPIEPENFMDAMKDL